MAYFIIPLDLFDYLGGGARGNWCSTQTWWTNQNIQLSGSSVSPTSARVGDTVSIQVGIQGVADGILGSTVSQVNAWVCYPNTVPGAAGPLVPSMQTGPTPVWTGSYDLEGSNDPGVYQVPGPYFNQFTLNNTWSPTQADILETPGGNGDTAHCCILATCQGIDDTQLAGGLEQKAQPLISRTSTSATSRGRGRQTS